MRDAVGVLKAKPRAARAVVADAEAAGRRVALKAKPRAAPRAEEVPASHDGAGAVSAAVAAAEAAAATVAAATVAAGLQLPSGPWVRNTGGLQLVRWGLTGAM